MAAGATHKPNPKSLLAVKIGGLVARTLFILVLAVLTVRVASPQSETMRTLLETPDDFIRVVLGFALCAWCVVNLFVLPKDAEAYKTWLYLGLLLLPLSVLCTLAVW